jgi:hypothetical protein
MLDIGPMTARPERSTIPNMTTPATLSRVVLVPSRDKPRGEDKIRRYRLARLKLQSNERPDAESRFAHLRRAYD